MDTSLDAKKKASFGYPEITFLSLIVVLVAKKISPSVIPFELFEFWNIRGDLFAWFATSWPGFAGGFTYTLYHIIFRYDRIPKFEGDVSELFFGTFFLTASAGIIEEICFRWIIFLGAIVTVQCADFLFFGFLGFDLVKYTYLNAVGPLADFLSLEKLNTYLYHHTGWSVGAGLIATNFYFSIGHRHRGVIGVIVSWFMGLCLFWLMFQYGLFAVMTIHFFYNLMIIGLIAYASTCRPQDA